MCSFFLLFLQEQNTSTAVRDSDGQTDNIGVGEWSFGSVVLVSFDSGFRARRFQKIFGLYSEEGHKVKKWSG